MKVCKKHKITPAVIYGECIGCELEGLRLALATEKARSDSRLENVKAMSSYLDDVAEALGVPKPGTPVEGIGACWKVIEAIQKRNKALEHIASGECTVGEAYLTAFDALAESV